MQTQYPELKQLKNFVQFATQLQELAGPAAYPWLTAFMEGITEVQDDTFTFYDPGVAAKDIVTIAPTCFSMPNLETCDWARQTRPPGLKRLRFPSRKSLNKRLTNQMHFLAEEEHLVYVPEMMVFCALLDFESRPLPFQYLIRTGDRTTSRLLVSHDAKTGRFCVLVGLTDDQAACSWGDIGLAGITFEQQS